MPRKFLEAVLNCVNDVRSSADVPELQGMEESDINYAFATEVTIVEEAQGGPDENGEKVIIYALQSLLNGDQDADEQTNSNYRAFLSSNATHLTATIDIFGEGFTAKFLVVNKYLELDPVGPIIGGNIVLQGASLSSVYGPCICKVDYLPDNDDEYIEVTKLYPWEMMITPSDSETDEPNDQFIIPLSLGSEFQDGTLRFLVYVDDISKIPYNQADDNYNPNVDELICALEYSARTADDEEVNEKGVPIAHTDRVVSSIQLTPPGDDKQLFSEKGFISGVMSLGKGGLKADKSAPWPYHLYVNHDSLGSEGIEDLIWVRTPKMAGILTEVPDGYMLFEESEFSTDHDELSVCIAIKTGPDAVFRNIFMITCGTRSRSDADRMISKYLQECGGGEYRPAPNEVCNAIGQIAGIIMITGTNHLLDPTILESQSEKEINILNKHLLNDTDRERDRERDETMSNVTHSDDEREGTDELLYSNEQEAINALLKKITELEIEKEKGKQQNLDYQKKCATLLAKLDRSGTAGLRMVEMNNEMDTTVNDNTTEKENHFIDTLQLIQEGRGKLARQQSEFDQLNNDLQTRLDDKEFRANEISESFKAFKQEILRRSEHSRTGRGVSQRLIDQFEQADQRKDEDLEKVRLRHISTRTQLRKLEKNLRAREQLAEGLHMIDFEQLKIENQTLNEKIEERNEELAKLKRKKTNTVQILTHYREKLRFIEQNNEILREDLEELDNTVAKQRHFLNTYKHEKDAVRGDNGELRRRQGFATNEMLTTDYEKRKGTLEMVKASIKELQERHFLLTRQITVNTAKSKRRMGESTGFTLPAIDSNKY